MPRAAIGFRVAPHLIRTQPWPTCPSSQTCQSNRNIPLSREDQKQTSQNSCPMTERHPRQPPVFIRHINSFFTLHPGTAQVCKLGGERAFTGRDTQRDNRKLPICSKTLNCLDQFRQNITHISSKAWKQSLKTVVIKKKNQVIFCIFCFRSENECPYHLIL